ncbi:hypothetical protein RCL1_002100 [Eukaryota sp. TZLM3-RCL]
MSNKTSLGNYRLSSTELSFRTTKRVKKVLAGQYGLGDTIGEGQLGKVRIGWRLASNEQTAPSPVEKRFPLSLEPPESYTQVAVKVFNIPKLRKMRALNAVAAEIDALCRFSKITQHPNILKIYEVIQNISKERIYLVLEYLSGGTLSDLLSTSPNGLAEEVTLPLFKCIFSAVSFIHNFKVAHCDLKPDNIMFTSDHQVKLMDFGSSFVEPSTNFESLSSRIDLLQLNSTDNSDSIRGSVAFLPPELVESCENPVDYTLQQAKAADSWALGVLLHISLTGKFPFPSTDVSLVTVQDDIREYRLQIDAGISPRVRNLLQLFLHVHPSSRIKPSEAIKNDCLSDHKHTAFSFIGNVVSKLFSSANSDGGEGLPKSTAEKADSPSLVSFSPRKSSAEWLVAASPSSRSSSRAKSRGRVYDRQPTNDLWMITEDSLPLPELAAIHHNSHPPPPLLDDDYEKEDERRKVLCTLL